MPILYRALRRVLKLGLELYYVDIRATDRERVPAKGPVIFAANHPNSIMDTVVLGSQTDRTISYLARSGLFENALVALVFRNAGVIPLYRRQDEGQGGRDGGAEAGGRQAGNEASFRAAFEVLEQGGAIGIFPEGQNAPERHVREIKTGTARIALGAEAKNEFGLGVKVIPVGLNFEDRDRALTRVLVRFGEPIDCREYRDAWATDEREAVRALTGRIQEAIRAESVHVDDVRNTELVEQVARIYGKTIIHEVLGETPDTRSLDQRLLDRVRGTHGKKDDLDDLFTAKKAIADAVAWFSVERPDAVERIRRSLARHEDHLAQASLRRDFLDRPPATLSRRKEAVKLSLYAILLGPIALFGLLHNFIPARLTRRLAILAPDEAMLAFRRLIFGTVFFGIAYTLYALAAWHATGSPLVVTAYVFSLPFAGMWWVRYRRQLARYGNRLVVRALFRGNRRLITSLAIEREQLLLELDQLRKDYQARAGGGTLRAARAARSSG